MCILNCNPSFVNNGLVRWSTWGMKIVEISRAYRFVRWLFFPAERCAFLRRRSGTMEAGNNGMKTSDDGRGGWRYKIKGQQQPDSRYVARNGCQATRLSHRQRFSSFLFIALTVTSSVYSFLLVGRSVGRRVAAAASVQEVPFPVFSTQDGTRFDTFEVES